MITTTKVQFDAVEESSRENISKKVESYLLNLIKEGKIKSGYSAKLDDSDFTASGISKALSEQNRWNLANYLKKSNLLKGKAAFKKEKRSAEIYIAVL